MAKLAEKNILDYRQGGDTVDDFAQKYMAEMTRIYQFLNNIRTHNLDGTEQVEPEAYQLKAEDNKLYIRNAENSKWLYLFDVKYRMGMSDNVEATILTTDDVTSTTEALKLVKTNADGKVEVDTLGNANTATILQTGRELVITDSSGTNKGTAVVFDGSKNIEIAMPSTIGGDFKGTFNGSGDITGTFSGDSTGTFNGTGSLDGTFKGEAIGTFTGDLTGTFKGTASEYVPVTDIGTGAIGDIITTNGKLVKIDEDGLLPVDIRGNAGKLAGTRVAITNPEDGQVLAYRAASKTWNNEARAVIGEGKALSVYDGETLVAEYAGSKEVSLDLETTAIKGSIDKNTADIATANTDITALKDGTTPVAMATQADNATTADKATTADTCTGNSATATKLKTARTISLTGAVTGSGTFDGSANVSIATTGLIGKVEWYAGNNTPDGYLLCDGSAVSRTSYAKLYAVIGTTYGTGDGSTTFNLPCLTDGRFAEGNATPGTKRDAGLPNIDGYTMTYSYYAIDGWKHGALSTTLQTYGIGPALDSGSEGKYFSLNFSANASNGIYGNSSTVQPKSITLRPIIKYI